MRRSSSSSPFPDAVNPASVACSALSPAALVGTTLPVGFTESVLSNALTSPTAIAIAPDGRIFVCQQTGQLRVIRNGVLLDTPFVSLSVDPTGERGLLGVAFDPNFAINQYVYVYYTVATSPKHNRISRLIANGDVAVQGSEMILLDLDTLSNATNHNGGVLHFRADGKLYISVGDNATGGNAQNLGNLKGKILRINPDGSIPTDNPLYNNPTARHEIWAYGLRNPFTFAFRSSDDLMYINDVGQATWEEVDRGQAGGNYGWPTTEGPTNNPNFISPFYYYGHNIGCAIVGAAFYSPTTPAFPSDYIDSYIFGDYCGGWIHVFNPSTGQVSDFLTGATSIVDIHVGSDGNLYYLDRARTSLLKVTYSANVNPVIETQPQSQLISKGYQVTFSATASGPTPYTYQWKRNGIDIVGATSSTYKLTTALGDNGAIFTVLVSNPYGNVLSDQAVLSVTSNKPPTAQILTLITGTNYYGGMVVNFSGSASDFEDGDLPASAFTWQVNFHHNTHIHPFMPPTTGIKMGSFTIPTTGEVSASVYYI
jgi:glucose/arabinose dehydrogenase